VSNEPRPEGSVSEDTSVERLRIIIFEFYALFQMVLN